MNKTRRDLTFQYNQAEGRHGWLRLTPAYSVKLVRQIVADTSPCRHLLDPFSGTGTSGLACAELGIRATLWEINPFLVWVAKVKCASYTRESLEATQAFAEALCVEDLTHHEQPTWLPPMHAIERWWDAPELGLLSRLYAHIQQVADESVQNLLRMAFCRLLMQFSNAAFNHPSVSFKVSKQARLWPQDDSLSADFLAAFQGHVQHIIRSAGLSLSAEVQVWQGDSRQLRASDPTYDCVITSPPYPNRMSYIRELRPYMYWLGYLHEAHEAGELDWQAIGGTWGVATSRLVHWQPNTFVDLPTFHAMLDSVQARSPLLANYLHKYFFDVSQHLQSLHPTLEPGASVFYVVGNSKFYDVMVHTEQIYAHLLAQVGFRSVEVRAIRKRNSKKELFEYVVSAVK